MTNQDKIREAERIIREACPEITHVSLGCKFEYVGKTWVLMRITGYDGLLQPFTEAMEINEFSRLCPLEWTDNDGKRRGLKVEKFSNYDFKRFCKNAIAEIELKHVLRAMKLTGHSWESIKVIGNEMHFAIPNDEVTHFTDPDNGTPGENYNWSEGVWNLLRGWDGQSEETKLFVAGALGVK